MPAPSQITFVTPSASPTTRSKPSRPNPGLRTCTTGSRLHSSVVSRVPRPSTSMLPPSRTTGLPSCSTGRNGIRSARAARSGTRSSFRQSGYLAQALKWKRAMAILRAASFFTKIGPKSRAQPRSRGKGKNSTRARETPTRDRMRRADCSCRASGTRMRTISPGASVRTISPYTQGMVANFPGQSERRCGQVSHVASWGSHSAGMRKEAEDDSVKEATFDSAVRVDAAVAPEGPVAAHFLDAADIHFRDQDLLAIGRGLRDDDSERIGHQGPAPELETRAAPRPDLLGDANQQRHLHAACQCVAA